MGKGKGNIAYWIASTKIGQILFEISGFDFEKIVYILHKSKNKLPIKTRVIKLIY
jgi:ribosomal protein L16/L10AE